MCWRLPFTPCCLPLLGYATLIVHIALAMDVLILLPFSKFAHAYYRSVALFLHYRKPIGQPQEQAASVEA